MYHLRVFFVRLFVNVPKDERSNLDAKAKQRIFIGYNDECTVQVLYVEDILIVGKNIFNINRLKKKLGKSQLVFQVNMKN